MEDRNEMGLLVKDVAVVLDCSPEHVRRLYRAGVLHGHKEGKRLRIEPQSVRRYAGRHDLAQMRLACEWLALVDDRGHVERVAGLLRRTFALNAETTAEALRVWGADPGDIAPALEKTFV